MNKEQLLSRLDEVIVNDATHTSAPEFLATHLPFKNLKYTSSGIGNDIEKSISEDAFLSEHLVKQSDKHNLIIVQGDSGSGKSHFIRWLMEKYEISKDPNEIIVSIKRHQNTLKSAIAQILSSEALREMDAKEIFHKLTMAQELLEDTELLYSIKNNLLTKLEARTDFTDCKISKRESDKLIDFIKCNYAFEELLAAPGGPFDRIYKKISSSKNDEMQNEFDARFTVEDFNVSLEFREGLDNYDATRNAIRFAKEISQKEDLRIRVTEYLNSYIDSVIQLCLQMSGEDFTQIIYDLRKYLKEHNKSLTLFIEDITSFTGIDKSLLEALVVTNHGNDEICRIFSVVGTTKSHYNAFFPDNIKQRVTGRVFIEVESIFGEDNDVILMAGRYLNAINTTKDELNQWLQTGADLTQLPIAKLYNQHKWSLFNDPTLGEISLFPFNERAIIHLYNTLEEKTPRVFIKQVIKHVYERYIHNPDSFPGSWKDFKNYYDIPAWRLEFQEDAVIQQANDQFEELSCVLRVWGDRTVQRTTVDGEERVGDLPKEVFDTFHLPFITGKRTTEPSPGPKPPEPIKPEPPKPEQPKGVYEGKRELLRKWYQEEIPFADHKEFRTDISNFLFSFVDWNGYGVSSFLASLFFGPSGTSINRIGINGQPVEVNQNGLVLDRNQDDYNFLRALLAYKHLGERTWNFPDSTDYLLFVYRWITVNIEKLINLITNKVEDEHWDLMKWTVYNQYMISVLNGQITGQETDEELYAKIMNANDISRETEHSARWKKYIQSIKGDDVQRNKEFLIKNTNLLLGDASADTNKYFISAYSILQEIRWFKDHKWTLDDIPEVEFNNTQLHAAYKLMKTLLLLVPNLMRDEKKEFQQSIESIEKFVEDNEVEQVIYRIKAFLNQTLSAKAREPYSSEEFAIALAEDPDIHNIATEVKQTMKFIKETNEYNIEFFIKISQLSIVSLEKYLALLTHANHLLDRLASKYSNAMKESESEVKQYEDSIEILQDSISKVLKSLDLLGCEKHAVE